VHAGDGTRAEEAIATKTRADTIIRKRVFIDLPIGDRITGR